jgi:type I restriction enzyme M protein
MDASQYKDYVLVLLFVRYVSDKYADQNNALVIIPEGGSFADLVKLKGKPNIGEGINVVLSTLAEYRYRPNRACRHVVHLAGVRGFGEPQR